MDLRSNRSKDDPQVRTWGDPTVFFAPTLSLIDLLFSMPVM